MTTELKLPPTSLSFLNIESPCDALPAGEGPGVVQQGATLLPET